MGCNCGKYQEGGTIEKTRTFNEFEYNKLVDREKKEFFGYWSGYLWDITHKSSSDIVGKFNPKTKILYIFGNSDLNNPLVKWLQDNSKISREEYEKLANGGRLVGDKVLLSVGSHRAREKMNKAGISYVEKYGLETDTFGKHYYEINKKDLKKSLNITGIKVANPKGKLGTAVKPNYAKGGHIGREVSKCELEDMVGRKLDGWNDDIIFYGGKKYEKCFLRPYYKVK